MNPFTYRKAGTEGEAIAAARAGSRYIAGGTTLIDLMREGVEQPADLVDINGLAMRDIRSERDRLVLGALARMAEVADHPATRRLHPLVAEALLEGASPQLRNVASVGGNLLQRVRCPYFRTRDAACNKRVPGSGCSAMDGLSGGHAILGTSAHCIATHPSDLAVALVALDAVVLTRGPEGERRFPVEDLYRLPGDTPHLEHTLRPAELIVAVEVPTGPHATRARYLKVRDRASYEFALVSAAVALHVEGGVIRGARIAAGGVGTKPWRLRASEEALVGQAPGRAAYDLAGERAIVGANARAGNHYKVDLLKRTVVRCLEMTGDVA